MLRRLKSDVEKELLPKVETLLYTGFSDMQRDIYKKVTVFVLFVGVVVVVLYHSIYIYCIYIYIYTVFKSYMYMKLSSFSWILFYFTQHTFFQLICSDVVLYHSNIYIDIYLYILCSNLTSNSLSSSSWILLYFSTFFFLLFFYFLIKIRH